MPDQGQLQERLALLKALQRAQHAYSLFRTRDHRASGYGLTPAQADVVFTLGATEGLTCSEIGERTCITKGTLTGVIDRLQERGLVDRWEDLYDGRKTVVALTEEGQALYHAAYPLHAGRLASLLDELDQKTRDATIKALERITTLLS